MYCTVHLLRDTLVAPGPDPARSRVSSAQPFSQSGQRETQAFLHLEKVLGRFSRAGRIVAGREACQPVAAFTERGASTGHR